MTDHKAQGKKNREAGARFERKVRLYSETEGWIVDKFTNNIDLEKKKIIPAKSNRFLMRTMGFPDFVMWKADLSTEKSYKLQFIECKVNGTLSKIEKQKLNFLWERGFRCLVASRGEKFKIKFTEFTGYEENQRVRNI